MKRALGNLISKISPVYFFLTVSILAGIIFVFLIPPFQGGDEPLHFYRAYQVSELNLVVDKNQGNDFGGVLPISLARTVALTTNNSSLGNLKPDEKYSWSRTHQALHIKEKRTKREWVNFTSTAPYPFIAYIPQAAGVGLARLLGAPPIVMMYAGRLFNLFAWICLLALAIKIIPIKKWAVVFVGLIPVAITQAATLSADVATLGLFALFLALVLKLAVRKREGNIKDLILLGATAIALTLCKQISFIFIALLLLIPGKVFGSGRRAYFIKGLSIAAPLILYGLWLYVIRGLDLKSVFSHHQDPKAQIDFMIRQPLSFIRVLWDTYFFDAGDYTTRSLIGTFGWGNPSLSQFFITIGYIGFAMVVLINPSARFEKWLSRRQLLGLLTIAIIYWLGVTATLYAYYNPVKARTINGLQGRYFLPILFMAIPLVYSNWLKARESMYRVIAIFVPLLLLAASIITIFLRYY